MPNRAIVGHIACLSQLVLGEAHSSVHGWNAWTLQDRMYAHCMAQYTSQVSECWMHCIQVRLAKDEPVEAVSCSGLGELGSMHRYCITSPNTLQQVPHVRTCVHGFFLACAPSEEDCAVRCALCCARASSGSGCKQGVTEAFHNGGLWDEIFRRKKRDKIAEPTHILAT